MATAVPAPVAGALRENGPSVMLIPLALAGVVLLAALLFGTR